MEFLLSSIKKKLLRALFSNSMKVIPFSLPSSVLKSLLFQRLCQWKIYSSKNFVKWTKLVLSRQKTNFSVILNSGVFSRPIRTRTCIKAVRNNYWIRGSVVEYLHYCMTRFCRNWYGNAAWKRQKRYIFGIIWVIQKYFLPSLLKPCCEPSYNVWIISEISTHQRLLSLN